MDNLVHSLAGVALAGSLIPASTSAPVRRAVVVAAVVAANAPDLDFAYVWITEAPLGFLLHHRGHTHTLAGAIGLGGLILLALGFWGPVRRDPTVSTARLASIVGLAVSSHLLIDAANVFGVVLWYPFSTTWVFGDISFIFEPWLWVVLGVPIARHAEIPTRVAVLTATTAATAAAAAWSLIPIGILPLLAGVGAVWWYLAGKVPAHRRMATALVCAGAVFMMLAGLSAISRRQFEREPYVVSPTGMILDVVLEPDPATPWCWSGLVVSQEAGANGALSVRRGTVSLLPRVWPVTACVSAALFKTRTSADDTAALVWTQTWATPVSRLRAINATDCRAAAWLRFGRVPMLIDESLRDLRLENPVHDNFTALALAPFATGCPSHVPPWTPPRGDVLME